MADLSRRDFLRTASVGAAAAGALAASGGVLMTAVDSRAAALTASSTPDTGTSSSGTDVFAHVSDVATGQITVFHGTSAHTITDHSLARALARATQ